MNWRHVWWCLFFLSVTEFFDIQAKPVKNHVSSICSTWGREHFKTFDGDMYQFPGTCEYNLVSDCNAVYQEFSVHIKRGMENNGNPTFSYVVITINTLAFHLNKSHVIVNNKPVSTPFLKGGVQVENNADYVKLQAKVGITVVWNGEDAIMVELDYDYMNHTCGLCGNFDSVPGNDFIYKGRKTNPIEFGNKQKVHRPNDKCEDVYEGDDESTLPSRVSDSCKKFKIVCDQLHLESWSSCTSLINPELYIQACVKDLCSCEDDPTDFCLCSTLSEFSRQCSHAGGDPPSWRSKEFCAKQCPYNMVYSENGSPCMNTCTNQDSTWLCEDHNMDGCFCPSGTVFDDISERGCIPQSQCQCKHIKIYESGEVYRQDREECTCREGSWECKSLETPETCAFEDGSHVTTFDGKTLAFHGNCFYTLVKVESMNGTKPAFTILAQLIPCADQELDTCLKTVKLLMDNSKNNVIVFTSDGTVKQNSQTITLPYYTGEISIFTLSSFHVLLQTSFGLQIQIQHVPIMQVFIRLDPSYFGKTRGLCGNYNRIMSDDTKTRQGIVEGTATTFIDSWKADDLCLDSQSRLEDPCSFSVENDQYSKYWCTILLSKNSTFAPCYSVVDPDAYYKRCIYSTCNCEKSEACLCGVFSSYGRACASNGVVFSDWKENVCDKYMKSCPASQVFSFNHHRCQLSCRSLALKKQSCLSDFSPVDGCTCAEGFYLDDNHICVPVSKCPCFYDDVYIKPGKSVSIKDEHCVCSNGVLNCQPLTPKPSTCVAPKVFFNCSSAAADDLEQQCIQTCSYPDKDDCEDSSECESGCRCPDGLLDDGKGSCVKKNECPCNHNGRLYAHRSQIQNQCNKCACKSGKWACTEKRCPATCIIYGSGHYTTFDQKTYTFQGNCAYTAVKNTCSNKTQAVNFGVVTENVPCGSTGTTCSKSVRVYLGRNEIKLFKGKYQEQDLGSGDEIEYKIRRVGLYLLIESSIGLAIVWDRRTTVRILLEPKHMGQVCGLCGNYDGDGLNDFTTMNHLVVSSPLEFGNSWKVSSSCPDTETSDNACEASPNRHQWSKMMCSIITGNTFKDCHKTVDPSPFYENCVKDSCACDSGGDCECFCAAVATYAQACSEAGVCVSWRTPDICPVFCDYYNHPDACEWHYSPCHTPCFKTCLNPKGVCINPIPNLEGCFPVCPDEKPFLDERSHTCVKFCATTPPISTPTATSTVSPTTTEQPITTLPTVVTTTTTSPTTLSTAQTLTTATVTLRTTVQTLPTITTSTTPQTEATTETTVSITTAAPTTIFTTTATESTSSTQTPTAISTTSPTTAETILTTIPTETTTITESSTTSFTTTTVQTPTVISTTAPTESTTITESTIITTTPVEITTTTETPTISTTIPTETTTITESSTTSFTTTTVQTPTVISTTAPTESTTITESTIITTTPFEITTTTETPTISTTTPTESTTITETTIITTTPVEITTTTETPTISTTIPTETTTITESSTTSFTTPTAISATTPTESTTIIESTIITTTPVEITTTTETPTISTTIPTESTTTLFVTSPVESTYTLYTTTPELTTTIETISTTIPTQSTTTLFTNTPFETTTTISTTTPTTAETISTTIPTETTTFTESSTTSFTTPTAISTTTHTESTTITESTIITTTPFEITTTTETPTISTTTPTESTTTLFTTTTVQTPTAISTTAPTESTTITETTLFTTTPFEITTTTETPTISTTIPTETTTITESSTTSFTTTTVQTQTAISTSTPTESTTITESTIITTTPVEITTTTETPTISTTTPTESTTTLFVTSPVESTYTLYTTTPELTTTIKTISTTIPTQSTTTLFTNTPVETSTVISTATPTTAETISTTIPTETTTFTESSTTSFTTPTVISTTTPTESTTITESTIITTTPFEITTITETPTISTTTPTESTTTLFTTTTVQTQTAISTSTPTESTTITESTIVTTTPVEITTTTETPTISTTTPTESTTTLFVTSPVESTYTLYTTTPELTTTIETISTTIPTQSTTTLFTNTPVETSTVISTTTPTTAETISTTIPTETTAITESSTTSFTTTTVQTPTAISTTAPTESTTITETTLFTTTPFEITTTTETPTISTTTPTESTTTLFTTTTVQTPTAISTTTPTESTTITESTIITTTPFEITTTTETPTISTTTPTETTAITESSTTSFTTPTVETQTAISTTTPIESTTITETTLFTTTPFEITTTTETPTISTTIPTETTTITESTTTSFTTTPVETSTAVFTSTPTESTTITGSTIITTTPVEITTTTETPTISTTIPTETTGITESSTTSFTTTTVQTPTAISTTTPTEPTTITESTIITTTPVEIPITTETPTTIPTETTTITESTTTLFTTTPVEITTTTETPSTFILTASTSTLFTNTPVETPTAISTTAPTESTTIAESTTLATTTPVELTTTTETLTTSRNIPTESTTALATTVSISTAELTTATQTTEVLTATTPAESTSSTETQVTLSTTTPFEFATTPETPTIVTATTINVSTTTVERPTTILTTPTASTTTISISTAETPQTQPSTVGTQATAKLFQSTTTTETTETTTIATSFGQTASTLSTATLTESTTAPQTTPISATATTQLASTTEEPFQVTTTQTLSTTPTETSISTAPTQSASSTENPTTVTRTTPAENTSTITTQRITTSTAETSALTETPSVPLTPTIPINNCPAWGVVQNEKFDFCNCTVATCIGNNTLEILPYECPPVSKITCSNGMKPALVWDKFHCCQQYVCDCVCEGWGGSHYNTFDGSYYTFQGNCTYVLMEEISPTFKLKMYIDASSCGDIDKVGYCSKSIIVMYGSLVVRLQMTKVDGASKLEALANDNTLRLPFSQQGVVIINSGLNLILEIPRLEVFIRFGRSCFTVFLPFQYFGRNTQGHCGTCTNNQADDCMLPGGELVNSCAVMAAFWPVTGSGKTKCTKPLGVPNNTPEVRLKPRPCREDSVCDLLISRGPFSECHDFVDPRNFHSSCASDSCSNVDPVVECESLESYAAACAQAGVCVDWRNYTKICVVDCPSNKVYKPCSPAEQPTCEDNSFVLTTSIVTEGCFCPEGTTRFNTDSDFCVKMCGCLDPENNPREFNEQFEFRCQDCVCEVSKVVTCMPKVCPEPERVLCVDPGYILLNQTNPSDPCCLEQVCQCQITTCPLPKVSCSVGFRPILGVPEGKCCPEHTCVPKRVCVHQEVEYEPGSSVPGGECEDCSCTTKIDPSSGGLLKILCTVRPCIQSCVLGFEYVRESSDVCCGRCVQTHCVIIENGSKHFLIEGETWSPSRNRCEVYICARIGDILTTLRTTIPCPPLDESKCLPHTIQTAANGCCKICQEKEKGCKLKSMKSRVSHKGCQSLQEVDMPFCEGSCNTFTKYSQTNSSMQHFCSCCKETRFSKRSVKVQCLNGKTFFHSYLHVDECGCDQSDCNKASASFSRTRRSLSLI